MSAEYVFGLDKYQAETMFLDVCAQLSMQGEDESEIDSIANTIMDNVKLYPEYFPYKEVHNDF
jgi:hypothetical protein|tara:strand:+ start:144 stop:332 length:189 start_codon:yes stop_codon:yes gene_type:complete